MGHQLRYGRCVELCSCTFCGDGCFSIVAAFASIACAVSSSSDSMRCLNVAFSSKLVDPVHAVACRGCGSVVQSSSMRRCLLPSSGFTDVTLVDVKLSGDCPPSNASGLYRMVRRDVNPFPQSSFSDPIVRCLAHIWWCWNVAVSL